MPTYKPLAEILRPSSLAEFVGQRHLLDADKPIGKTLTDGKLHSMILWGPPGSGKTTLARIICHQMGAHFEQMSAVLEGIKELRNVLDHAQRYQQHNKSTVLFVDEIHRFNKAQQDAFLPHIESGLITLIGATTENPSFEINSSLLSRLRVYILKSSMMMSLVLLLTGLSRVSRPTLKMMVHCHKSLQPVVVMHAD